MNKLFTISLANYIFHLEEKSFFLLNEYLFEVEKNLNKTKEKKEILYDIELHIAEILTEKLNKNKIIIKENVEEIIKIMGAPEVYREEKKNQNEYKQENKKLFRDIENKYIAGICSGLAAYFGTKSNYLRLIVLLLFLFPTGLKTTLILAYIIAWILLPCAKTSSEKIQMQGKKINLENIKASLTKTYSKSKLDYFFNKIFYITNLLIKFLFKILKFISGIFLISLPIFILYFFSFYVLEKIDINNIYIYFRDFFSHPIIFYTNMILGSMFFILSLLISFVGGLFLFLKSNHFVKKNMKNLFKLWIISAIIFFISFFISLPFLLFLFKF